MNKIRSTKGITLISLVITIIILIILAGVGINLSLGENGIFNRAKFAKEKYLNSEEQEKKELDDLYSSILIATNENSTVTLNIEDLKKIIQQEAEKIFQEKNKTGITGINQKSDLLSSVSANGNVGTIGLNSFTNSFGEEFSKYFEYNSTDGILTCKESGWYIFCFEGWGNTPTGTSWSETLMQCYINGTLTHQMVMKNGTNGVQAAASEDISLYLNKDDIIKISRVINNQGFATGQYGAKCYIKKM